MGKVQEHVGAPGFPVTAEALPVRQPFKLTKEMALLAVSQAISPDSAYINDQVAKMHRAHIAAGGKGFNPRTDLVLSRLNALAKDGMLTKSMFPNGYYGYRWTITDVGRQALSEGEQT